MTPIDDILNPEHVNLSLEAGDLSSAVEEVMVKLSGDPRVKNYEAFSQAVRERKPVAIREDSWGICIAHGRTESVSGIVLGLGRSSVGWPCEEFDAPVRLVFVAGIPSAFNGEYLRVVGAIARICRDKRQLDRLLAAKTAESLIDLLAAGEVKF